MIIINGKELYTSEEMAAMRGVPLEVIEGEVKAKIVEVLEQAQETGINIISIAENPELFLSLCQPVAVGLRDAVFCGDKDSLTP